MLLPLATHSPARPLSSENLDPNDATGSRQLLNEVLIALAHCQCWLKTCPSAGRTHFLQRILSRRALC
jgi:hypothetical protein